MRYYFKQWQDGDENTQKIITLTGDLTLTAYYEQGFTLAVSSTPVPAQFTINGQQTQTPFNQVLMTGNYNINMPLIIGDYKFKEWNDSDTNPNKSINLTSDLQLVAIYEYVAPPPPPPEKGRADIHAFIGATEIIAQVEIVGVGTFTTPFTQDLTPGTYTLNMTYEGQTTSKNITIVSQQTLRVDLQASTAPVLSATMVIPLIVIGGIAIVYFAFRKKK